MVVWRPPPNDCRLILIYSAAGIRFYYRHPEFVEDLGGASTHVLAHLQAGDVVIVGSSSGLVFDYYRDIARESAAVCKAGIRRGCAS